MTASQMPAANKPAILFVNENGAGIGHLTRLLSIARRLSPAVQPWFLTLSQAPKLIRDFAIPADYMPSPSLFPEQGELWNSMLADRLSGIVKLLAVSAVVFDGTFPYSGLIDARINNGDVKFVWCRRGRWKRQPSESLQVAHHFDVIIEPDELPSPPASAAPAGTRIFRVPPILLLDPDELADNPSSNRHLGLTDSRDAILVQLGAGNINSLATALESSFAALRESTFRSAQMCWSGSPISKTRPRLPRDVKDVSHFPISRFFKRFLFGISAAGYNSFHEHIAYGLPAIFIPNENTITDDQYGRARAAQEQGLAIVAENESKPALLRACALMDELLHDSKSAMREPPMAFINGARQAANLIESLVTVQ